MIKLGIKLGLFLFMGITLLNFTSCEPPPSVVLNPNLTTEVTGDYTGNYIVNYPSNPQDDISSQISLKVYEEDNKIIRVDAQGGDSFECTIAGSVNNLTLSNITNTKGVYTQADHITGNYINGRLYYKVTGTANTGGDFIAEFTAI